MADKEDDPLYQAALAVERDTRLAAEMADWEAATLGDSLSTACDPRRIKKRARLRKSQARS